MNSTNFNFINKGVNCSGTGDFFTKEDLALIDQEYFNWKSSNEIYQQFGMRRATVPELVTEGLTSAVFNWARTNAKAIKGLAHSSMDLIDPISGDTIQLKACSTAHNVNPGPTSFGPATEFDKLYFLHIDCDNNHASWYYLGTDEYVNWKVNKTQTIADQQAEGRRPRLNVLAKVKENKLKPIYEYTFGEERE